MNVLSLFDGMSCGQQALERAGINVNNYYASEIDKYGIKVTMANYPNTIQLGSVVDVDGYKLPKIDLLIGGSPCQSFSFAMPRSSTTGKGGTGHLSRADGKTYCLDTGNTNAVEIVNSRIRRLTPIECERLQTVADNYTNHVSDSQRYKMLGNGWTVDVIAHIFKYITI
jgi:site-specific DNA-cytosine methylase